MKLFNFRKQKPLSTKILVIANIIAFIAMIVINYLATSLPIWGLTTGQLSDLYPNLFTPAGITFSIWGLIYLSLLGFIIWQAIDFFKNKGNEITKKLWIWFIMSCITNIWRIFAWHNQKVFLSVLIMLLFLIILTIISKKINIWKKTWSIWNKYLVETPFSLYLGWISVATIANISTLLVNIWWGWRWISPITWTIISIIVATILALLALYKNKNVVFALVIIWAFLWIILKTLWAEIIYTQIVWTLWIAIMIISTGIWYKFKDWKNN